MPMSDQYVLQDIELTSTVDKREATHDVQVSAGITSSDEEKYEDRQTKSKTDGSSPQELTRQTSEEIKKKTVMLEEETTKSVGGNSD